MYRGCKKMVLILLRSLNLRFIGKSTAKPKEEILFRFWQAYAVVKQGLICTLHEFTTSLFQIHNGATSLKLICIVISSSFGHISDDRFFSP